MNDLVPPKGTMSIDPDDLSEAAEAVEATRVADDVEPANDAEATPEEPVINEQQAAMLMQTFAEEQNLLMGTISGLLAALRRCRNLGWRERCYRVPDRLDGGRYRFHGWSDDALMAARELRRCFGTVSRRAVAGRLCLVGNILTFTWFIADIRRNGLHGGRFAAEPRSMSSGC